MSILSKLFGGSKKAPTAEVTSEDYKGFRITPDPIPEGRQFRIAARIEKEVDGEAKLHELIRADTLEGYEQAVSASTAKARQMIDEQGERIFRR